MEIADMSGPFMALFDVPWPSFEEADSLVNTTCGWVVGAEYGKFQHEKLEICFASKMNSACLVATGRVLKEKGGLQALIALYAAFGAILDGIHQTVLGTVSYSSYKQLKSSIKVRMAWSWNVTTYVAEGCNRHDGEDGDGDEDEEGVDVDSEDTSSEDEGDFLAFTFPD